MIIYVTHVNQLQNDHPTFICHVSYNNANPAVELYIAYSLLSNGGQDSIAGNDVTSFESGRTNFDISMSNAKPGE